MKLSRDLNRRDKETGKEYWRWTLHPPSELVEQLGWEPGQELEVAVVGTSLVVSPAVEKRRP